MVKQRCMKCDILIDPKVDEHFTSSWTYGNGRGITLYYCPQHEPFPKRARKAHRNRHG